MFDFFHLISDLFTRAYKSLYIKCHSTTNFWMQINPHICLTLEPATLYVLRFSNGNYNIDQCFKGALLKSSFKV